MADVPTILCWTGGWGLPSLDPACLQTLAYAQFAGFPVKQIACDNPYRSPTGNLPALHLPDNIFSGCDEILEHLKSADYDPDRQLTDKQKIETSSLCCYIEDMLRPAIMYMMWLNDPNYTQFTRGWFTKELKFPYNFVVPGRFCNHARNFVAHKLNIDEDDVVCDETEEKLNRRAKACFETLSTLLADKEYFFGESPTTLDSKVLAYLAVILKAPLPKNKLKSELTDYPELEQFCDRILRVFFPAVVQEQFLHNNTTPSQTTADDSKSNKVNAILSVGFAVVAMVFYALSSGLVSIEMVDHAEHRTADPDPSGTEADM